MDGYTRKTPTAVARGTSPRGRRVPAFRVYYHRRAPLRLHQRVALGRVDRLFHQIGADLETLSICRSLDGPAFGIALSGIIPPDRLILVSQPAVYERDLPRSPTPLPSGASSCHAPTCQFCFVPFATGSWVGLSAARFVPSLDRTTPAIVPQQSPRPRWRPSSGVSYLDVRRRG